MKVKRLRPAEDGVKRVMNRGLCLPLLRTATATAVLIGAPVMARSPGLADAKAFVASVYAHYPTKTGPGTFDPTGKNAGEIFDRATAALLREDARLANGEEGAIDADPICQCQDDTGMKVDGIAVSAPGPDRVVAKVRLRFAEMRPAVVVNVDLDLVVEHGRWRVHDIRSHDMASLRRALIEGDKTIARETRR